MADKPSRAAPKTQAPPRGQISGQAMGAPEGNGAVTNFALRAPSPAAPQPRAARPQPVPNAVIGAPRRSEDTGPPTRPAPETALNRRPSGQDSQPETAAAPPEDAEAPPAAESAPRGGSAPDTPSDADSERQPAEVAQPEPEPAPEAVAEAEPEAQPEAAAPAETETETSEGDDAAQPEAQVAASADADGPCPERGVLGPECFDVDAALEHLRERPVEYNHPEQMIRGQATEITLALRTDFTGEGLPEEVSEAFENLQGEVKQQRAKIANIMSARLRGRDFDVDPPGMQERTVTWRRPVEWTWYVTPREGGENKRLELELYAHIVNPQGETQPPVLIKTLDATIDVDVRTLDWLIEQARTFEPIYAIAAAILGLFTALITLWLRRRPAHTGDAGPPSGITASQAPTDRRIEDMSASEAAAAAARKGQDDDDGGGSQNGSRA